MLRLVLLWTAVLLLPAPFASAEPQGACVPQCRTGYMCRAGTCLSRCNPVCAADQKCTAAGECVAKGPAVASAPAGEVRAGLMGGAVLAGRIYADPPDDWLDTEPGFIVRGTLDRLLTRNFSLGLYAHYLMASARYGGQEEDFTTLTFGGTLKVVTPLSPTMELRLGLGLGYQMTNVSGLGADFENLVGLDVAPITELAMKVDGGTALVSVAAFSQPTGGSDEIEAVWPPIVIICGGVEL